jgi:hypothetical protein
LVHRSGLDDLAGPNARSADTRPAGVGPVLDPDSLNVGKPTPVAALV